MRGTLSRIGHLRPQSGIIPAYAGNTYKHVRGWKFRRDHPRVCGEHVVGERKGSVQTGSSPRMRGTPFPTSKPCVTMGIIPAYAGNTSMPSETPPAHRDHPRVCGEHRHIESFARELPGSSPRMRGTPQYLFAKVDDFGIIPAYAGNTSRPGEYRDCRRDHPRVCGEHLEGHAAETPNLGSSPRMRGTPPDCKRIPPAHGIIPAYAGNTSTVNVSRYENGDHPRVCGEHSNLRCADRYNWGSSPRMRGTHIRHSLRQTARGIIPAYAGNTRVACRVRLTCGDHPRVCGEHSQANAFSLAQTGSSPRMRGTREA